MYKGYNMMGSHLDLGRDHTLGVGGEALGKERARPPVRHGGPVDAQVDVTQRREH